MFVRRLIGFSGAGDILFRRLIFSLHNIYACFKMDDILDI